MLHVSYNKPAIHFHSCTSFSKIHSPLSKLQCWQCGPCLLKTSQVGKYVSSDVINIVCSPWHMHSNFCQNAISKLLQLCNNLQRQSSRKFHWKLLFRNGSIPTPRSHFSLSVYYHRSWLNLYQSVLLLIHPITSPTFVFCYWLFIITTDEGTWILLRSSFFSSLFSPHQFQVSQLLPTTLLHFCSPISLPLSSVIHYNFHSLYIFLYNLTFCSSFMSNVPVMWSK